ncbi:hypothetical protein N665_0054s0028 [Sinapis alba]|nr:hypothetical protein N665_0054s0028 [Sinapis alba]
MRLGYLAIFSGFIEGRKYSSATRASMARLVIDLEKFENYPWGRVAFKVLMDSLKAKDFTKSYTVDGFIQVLQLWIYHALPELGANYGNLLQNKPSPPLLAFKGGKGRKCFKDAINRHVVFQNSTTYIEEDIERPSKRARIEAPAEPRPEDIPNACLGVILEARFDKAYIEKSFKDLTDVMRDGFGTCLKEVKLLGNRMNVVEKKMGITGKETSSDDFQQTISSLSKSGFEHGESVNVAKARHDEEPSFSNAPSVEAKEKEVKEGKENELKENANKGLEKVLVKEKEAKANEAKANEAKAKEAKAKEAKAKVAKTKEEEAKEKETKEKETKKKRLRKRKPRKRRPRKRRKRRPNWPQSLVRRCQTGGKGQSQRGC